MAVSSSYQSMVIGAVWGSSINVIIHDDHFASGVASSQDQDHLLNFHKLAYFDSSHLGLQQKGKKNKKLDFLLKEVDSNYLSF